MGVSDTSMRKLYCTSSDHNVQSWDVILQRHMMLKNLKFEGIYIGAY